MLQKQNIFAVMTILVLVSGVGTHMLSNNAYAASDSKSTKVIAYDQKFLKQPFKSIDNVKVQVQTINYDKKTGLYTAILKFKTNSQPVTDVKVHVSSDLSSQTFILPPMKSYETKVKFVGFAAKDLNSFKMRLI